MDFLLKSTNNTKLRLGLIRFADTNVPSTSPVQVPDRRSYSLPLCLQYTRDGLVPHLTWDLVKYTDDGNAPVVISLSSVFNLLPILQSGDQKLSEFICSSLNRPIFLVAQDSLVERRKGFNSPNFMPIWTESGRKNIYPIDLIECVKAFQPDAYQLLTDGETSKDASNKRISRSIQNTIGLAQNTFYISDSGWTSRPVFGSIVGGWNFQSRLASIEKLKSFPVDGYIIDGFLADDLLADPLDQDFRTLISQICSHLPPDKPRALFGPLKPEKVIKIFSYGIDMIDSSYCSYLTEKETALLIEFKADSFEVTSDLLKLTDELMKQDFEVIKCDCKCYTCSRGFTRAYINHLIKANEMLAPILINLHNLFVYYKFINQIRSYLNSCDQKYD